MTLVINVTVWYQFVYQVKPNIKAYKTLTVLDTNAAERKLIQSN